MKCIKSRASEIECNQQKDSLQLCKTHTLPLARIIFSQKIFGLYGLKYLIVEISGDDTDAGQMIKQAMIRLLSWLGDCQPEI